MGNGGWMAGFCRRREESDTPAVPSYARELKALQRAGLFRERRLFDPALADFASNDYLGLAHRRKSVVGALKRLDGYDAHAPKASLLVNGYHPIHREFEERIATLNGFEAGLVVGSGFLANLALIEALVRRKDRLFIDEEYHASGILATSLIEERVTVFRHNDPEDLWRKLRSFRGGRAIVAVEGVYSMSGELAKRELFDVAEENGALLIVDEAHSSGVLGENLLGVFEHYGIEPGPAHIKMGTLGKAYGSYGAYILASREIVSYLENRGKPIIYSTAPSVFDIALALENLEFIRRRVSSLKRKLMKRRKVVYDVLGVEMYSQILTLSAGSNNRAMKIQHRLMEEGFVVGAIRQPTVPEAILRIIPRIGVPPGKLIRMLKLLEAMR